jgi:hypothetical protein
LARSAILNMATVAVLRLKIKPEFVLSATLRYGFRRCILKIIYLNIKLELVLSAILNMATGALILN